MSEPHSAACVRYLLGCGRSDSAVRQRRRQRSRPGGERAGVEQGRSEAKRSSHLEGGGDLRVNVGLACGRTQWHLLKAPAVSPLRNFSHITKRG